MADLEDMTGVVAEHGPRLGAIALGLLGNSGEAADAVQESLVSAWTNRDRFHPGTDLGAWLTTLCLNHCRMRLRRRGRERKALAGYRPPSPSPAEAPTEAAERERALREALAELPEKEREAFLLIALGGLGSVKAAEALGCSPAAARVHLGRARLALARRLEKFLRP